MTEGMDIPKQFESVVETNKENWAVTLNVRFFAPEGNIKVRGYLKIKKTLILKLSAPQSRSLHSMNNMIAKEQSG